MSFTIDSSDPFELALSNLFDKLEAEDKGLLGVRRLFRSTIEDFASFLDPDKGLLQGLGRRLFGSRIEDSPWIQDLGLLAYELWYWRCHSKVLMHIHKCSSNADKIVPSWGSLVRKYEAAFSEIAKDISGVCQYKKIAKRPFETLRVFRDSEKKIGLLKLEIGEALDQLSSSCCFGSLEWHLPVLARCLPNELLAYLSEILELIGMKSEGDQSVDGELNKGIEDFKNRFISPLLSFIKAAPLCVGPGYPSDDIMIQNNNGSFFTHIAFVAVRIANQSLHYWNNTDPVVARSKITGILDLRHEIDPLTHQFLGLALQYLRAVNVISPGRTEHLASSFLNYTLAPRWCRYDDSEWKLKPLVIFVINEWEEPHSEDVQGLLAEIKPVLLIAGLMHCRGLQFLDRSPFELRTRISLLNAEVFLKQQLKSSSISLESKVAGLRELISGLESSSHQQQLEIESGRQNFTSLDQVASELACLLRSSCNKEATEDNLRISLFKLLLNIVIFKAELTCKEFLKGNTKMIGIKNEKIETPVEGLNFVTSQQEQIRTFLEGLNVFNAFVTNQQEKMTEGIEPIFTRIEAIARGITYLCCSFPVFNITEEITKKWATSYSDFLDKMILIKAELRETFSQQARSNFPKIHGIGFMDSLLENLLELIKLDPNSIALVKHLIERIRLDLEFLLTFLMKQDTEHLEHNDLCTRVMYAAYEVEYIIDTIEAGIGDHWQHLLELYNILEEIRLVKVQATKTYEEKTSDARASAVAQISGKMVLRITPEIGEPIVCLSDDEGVIINRLTRGSPQRDIISIVGMPGIGKTTLAKKVYNDPRVTFHFDVRAWCAVSQVYGERDLLLDILSNICGLTDDIHQMTNEDLELKLYQCLKQNRYLIVMDDVWDNGALAILEGSFPNDGNGSRILITSRYHDVALRANSDPLSLHPLSDDESWQLLQMKIFEEGFPDELVGVGKEIAKTCKGLPLAVVAIAGVLERTEKKQDKWKEIAETLSSRIIDDPQTQCMDILQLSYNSLPDYLKACFLYFGVFLEDKTIPVSKLIRLWIAEGFIQKTMLKSLEDLAEDYLIDLIGRSLVTVSRIGSMGKVKALRIHDLLRDLCLSEAKEVNFLQQITGGNDPYASLSAVDFDDDFCDYHLPDPVTYEKHRVCICLKRNHFILSSPCGPCSRSLIFFAASDRYPRRPYDISFIPRHFKILRVLDLETINMGHCFPTGLVFLVQLRYLALSGDIEYIPPSIANLRKLETLILKGLKGKVILPDSLWSMARLRHIHVNDLVDFNLGDDELESSFLLDNLVSFSSPKLSYGKDAEKIMRRFPNLRKLRCVFVASWDPSRNCYKFPELQYLIQLESLKIFCSGGVFKPLEFTLPWNLKKLTLSNFRLPWIHISAVGRLENLEVLKLLSKAFEGLRWDMREGEFLKLKYLELDTLNIAQWNASNDHLPNLQHLVLRNCKDLEEVPYNFREIPTLQMIEVQSCRRSTEESVRSIGDEGIEGIKIIINHKIHI